jgi:GntR family transcriptional regulator
LAVNEEQTKIGFRPLYAQVKDQLIGRLVDGTWPPGMHLPSEQELARQLSVSQGTVRKALDAMTAESLLVRRQGRGTFVAEPEDARILFQFFRLAADRPTGENVFPDSHVLKWSGARADDDEADALDLEAGDPVWRIERIRMLAGQPVLVESISLPASIYEGFDTLESIPNNVYQLYSTRWHITIAKADERLKAITACRDDAKHLRCPDGEPLLQISRIARNLQGNPVELRVSRCLTRSMHYAVSLP